MTSAGRGNILQEDRWPSIAVLGAGAVGCYFGGLLARAGAPVTLIGRPQHVEAIRRSGLLLETKQFREYVPVSASTDPAAVGRSELVLFCVKTLDTESAARLLAPHLPPSAVVVSLQNGVDNVERIRSVSKIDGVPAVVYVGAEMVARGHVKHTARGELIVGDLPRPNPGDLARQRQLDSLVALFLRAGIPCKVSDNIQADLWTKLIINCAYNAISAVTQQRYGRIAGNPATREIMRQIVEEAVAVGRAAGVSFPKVDLVQAAWKLAETMPGTLSSTAQDIARGKPTEIDSLNGYIARRGAELGIPAPVNQTLRALVKLLEDAFEDRPQNP
jgi:2-dehydropantoate 2-reductase